ncbi:MAG: ABC transporter substrate-binding protein [Promethearchaeota archaeon]
MKYKKKDVVIGVLAVVIVSFGVINIILGLPSAILSPPLSKTFVIGTQSPPFVLDPVDSLDSSSNFVLEQVVETLFSYNLYDHTTPRVPLLAETWWWENSTTLHIKLKEGILFHDLNPFDANATKWNLDRMLYFFNCTGTLPTNTSVADPAFLYYFSDGVTPIIKSVISDYAYNVTIYLNDVFGPFLDLLSYTSSSMLSPNSTPRYRYINLIYERVVGTGPFVYEYYTPNVEIELGRFESYWEGPAFFETVVMTIIGDSIERNNAMLNHSIDWLTGGMTTLYPTFEVDPLIHLEKFTEKYGLPGLTYCYLGMNNKKINVTWRKAISYAINYTYMLEILGYNFVVRADSPISPGFGTAYNASVTAADYNLTVARQTLVDAGIATGYPINADPDDTYWLNNPLVSFNYTQNVNSGFREVVAAVLIAWLPAIGINVVNDRVTWSEYLDRLFNRHDYLELFWICWGPYYKEPFDMLDHLFNPISYANSAQVNDTKLNTMMALALETTDDTARNTIYKNIQWYLANRLFPHCFGYHQQVYYIHSADLRAVPYNALGKFYAYPIYRT